MDRFVLVGNITEISDTNVSSVQSFSDTPGYMGIEALAQLGAMHVRHLTDFSQHVFLLKIKECTLPQGNSPTYKSALPQTTVLNGPYRLSGVRQGSSDRACSYRLTAEGEDENICFGGIFLFGSVGYDRRFDKTVLQKHYRKIFSCLTNG